MKKGLLLGIIQVAIVLSVTGQFAFDRATLPRAWVRSGPVDPSLPIRGRYVRLRLEVEAPCATFGESMSFHYNLFVENGVMKGKRVDRDGHVVWHQGGRCLLQEPVAYFIPPEIPDPSILKPGEELWVEVSVPKNGPPRPTQLAVKRDGQLQPLRIN